MAGGLIASAYAMENAECFDVIEACVGWLRAMHIARSFLLGENYRNMLILNAEAIVHEGEYGHETSMVAEERDLE